MQYTQYWITDIFAIHYEGYVCISINNLITFHKSVDFTNLYAHLHSRSTLIKFLNAFSVDSILQINNHLPIPHLHQPQLHLLGSPYNMFRNQLGDINH